MQVVKYITPLCKGKFELKHLGVAQTLMINSNDLALLRRKNNFFLQKKIETPDRKKNSHFCVLAVGNVGKVPIFVSITRSNPARTNSERDIRSHFGYARNQ